LLHRYKKRVEFPELKRQVASLASEWKPNIILIEEKASGTSLVQEIKQSTRFAVRPIKVDTDKLSRAYAPSPLVECGKVFLPKAAPWLEDYLTVMSTFPVAAHDDDVDSTTQALNYMRGSNMSYGLWGAMKILQSGSREQVDAALGRTPAPLIQAATPTCGEFGSDFIQKMPRGSRCGQCGHQWGAPAEAIPANQRMPVQNAWRM
jgi:predicted phage terminase large subunit-like protein